MSLSSEQKQAVASWVAAGANLSAVQKKLLENFKISMTYMDVRFLVDDLDLALKDPAPKVSPNDVTKAPTPKAPEPVNEEIAEASVDAEEALPTDEAAPEDVADALPPEGEAKGGVSLSVDRVTLIPGALASGTVTFSDGVTGKWIVDNYGRPGFTEVSKPGYRPTAADAQSFMQELSAALSGQGM